MRRDYSKMDQCWPKLASDGIKFIEVKRWYTDDHDNLIQEELNEKKERDGRCIRIYPLGTIDLFRY